MAPGDARTCMHVTKGTLPTEQALVGVHPRIWSACFEALVEVRQPNETHGARRSDSCSRLDRMYVATRRSNLIYSEKRDHARP